MYYIFYSYNIISYQVKPDELERATFDDPKLNSSLLVFDKLYKIIILCAALLGISFPKSISSIEKNTLDPIVETKLLYLGISYLSNLFNFGGFLL
jgi:hypothetical protein